MSAMPPPPPGQNPPPGYTPYPPQPYTANPYVAPQMPKADGLAIAALVLGILWIYWIGSILAVIFAGVAIRRINQSQGWRTGKGMAIAGLVLGLVGCGTLAFTLILAGGS